MIPWIQVYSNIQTHPKTTKLADILGIKSQYVNPNVIAVGMLISLWTWAIQNAYDGDLSGVSDRAIAEAMRWMKKPEEAVNGLIRSGYLDSDRSLHDWDEYASLLIEAENQKRQKTRERVQRYRARKREAEQSAGNAEGGVTEQRSNAATLQDITEQDNTKPSCNDLLTDEERERRVIHWGELAKSQYRLGNYENARRLAEKAAEHGERVELER